MHQEIIFTRPRITHVLSFFQPATEVIEVVDGRYYTPQQAAEILGTDDEQVTHWINSGQLVAVNVAKSPAGKRPRWRISESDLGKFLLSRRNPAAAPKVERAPKIKEPKRYV